MSPNSEETGTTMCGEGEADNGGEEERDFQTEEQAQRRGRSSLGDQGATEGSKATPWDTGARPFPSSDHGETEAQSGGGQCPHSKAES